MRLDTILEILLENARETWVISNMGPKLEQAAAKDRFAGNLSVEDIVSKLKDMDPTKNSQYLQWIAKQYADGKFRLEDANRVKSVVSNFHKFKPRLQQRDINKMDLYTLEQQIDDILSGADSVEMRETPYTNLPDVEYLYKGPLGILAVPKTEAASCELGRGTKWCTAANKDNMFNHYNSRGKIYIWIDRSGKKYQFWWDADPADGVNSDYFVVNMEDMEHTLGFREFDGYNLPIFDEDEIKKVYLYDVEDRDGEQLMDERDQPLWDDDIEKLRQIPVLNKLFNHYRQAPRVEIASDLKELLDSIKSGVPLDSSTLVNLIKDWPITSEMYFEEMQRRHGTAIQVTPDMVDAIRAQDGEFLGSADEVLQTVTII